MKSNSILSLPVFLLSVFSTLSLYAQPLSEIEKTTQFVDSYMSQNEAQLIKLLRGFSGIQVNIHFRSNSAEINWQKRQDILNIVRAMWIYPMINVGLEAYSDGRGSAAYNKRLSEKRIAAVQQVIKDVLGKKYNSKRVYTNVIGSQQASHEESDIEGMAFDRRVSIRLLVQSNYPEVSNIRSEN